MTLKEEDQIILTEEDLMTLTEEVLPMTLTVDPMILTEEALPIKLTHEVPKTSTEEVNLIITNLHQGSTKGPLLFSYTIAMQSL